MGYGIGDRGFAKSQKPVAKSPITPFAAPLRGLGGEEYMS